MKRLSGICAQIIPFLTQEVSGLRGGDGERSWKKGGGGGLAGCHRHWFCWVAWGPGHWLGWGLRDGGGVLAEGEEGGLKPTARLPRSKSWLCGLGLVACPLCASVMKFRAVDTYKVVKMMLGA